MPSFKEELDFSEAAPFSLSTDFFGKANLKVFPNPVSNIINVSASVPIEKIEIYNAVGAKVIEFTETKHLDVQRLNGGIYLMKIISNNRHTTKKVVIE